MKKLFNIFAFLFLFIPFIQIADAKLLTVDVIADTHISLSQDEKGVYVMTPSIRNLKNAVRDINRTNADYVIFAGDCVNSPTKEALAMFAKIINSLHRPYYVLNGNHDVMQVAGIDKKKFYHLINRFSKNRIKKLPSVKVVDNKLVFIFMDGVNQFIPGAKGYYTEDNLHFLDKKLNKYKNKHVVIFQHFPIVEPKNSDYKKTVNEDEYKEVLSKYNNVRAIVSGHYHIENEITEDNIMHISVPALADDAQYKELNIEYSLFGDFFEIRTKIHDAI